MSIDHLTSALEIVKAIYDAIQLAKANRERCRMLGDKIKMLEPKIAEANQMGVSPAAIDILCNTLSAALELVEEQGGTNFVLAVLQSSSFESKLAEIEKRLAESAIDLGVSLQVDVLQEVQESKADLQELKHQIAVMDSDSRERDVDQTTLMQEILAQLLEVKAAQVQQLTAAASAPQPPTAPQQKLSDMPSWGIPADTIELDYEKKGKFDVPRKIASGSVSDIYSGTFGGVPVAIKKIRCGSPAPLDIRERYIREVTTHLRLVHPNIVSFKGATLPAPDDQEGELMLVMEMLDGGTLSSRIAKGSMGVQEKFDIALGIISGLVYLHNSRPLQVLHLDLKPENILFAAARPKVPRIIDFGLAYVREIVRSTTSFIGVQAESAGTAGYACPEMASGGGKTDRADVFALGVILAELFAGRRLWGERLPEANAIVASGGAPAAIEALLQPLAAGGSEEAEVVRSVMAIAVQCCAKSAADRPSAAEVFAHISAARVLPTKRLHKDPVVEKLPNPPLIPAPSSPPNQTTKESAKASPLPAVPPTNIRSFESSSTIEATNLLSTDDLPLATAVTQRNADLIDSLFVVSRRQNTTLDLKSGYMAVMTNISEEDVAVNLLRRLRRYDSNDVFRKIGLLSIALRKHNSPLVKALVTVGAPVVVGTDDALKDSATIDLDTFILVLNYAVESKTPYKYNELALYLVNESDQNDPCHYILKTLPYVKARVLSRIRFQERSNLNLLQYAAVHQVHCNLIPLALAHGCDPNYGTPQPIAFSSCIEAVDLLVDKTNDPQLGEVLCTAASNGNAALIVEVVRKYQSKYPISRDCVFPSSVEGSRMAGLTPVMCAVASIHLKAFCALASLGFNFIRASTDNWTPFSEICSQKPLESNADKIGKILAALGAELGNVSSNISKGRIADLGQCQEEASRYKSYVYTFDNEAIAASSALPQVSCFACTKSIEGFFEGSGVCARCNKTFCSRCCALRHTIKSSKDQSPIKLCCSCVVDIVIEQADVSPTQLPPSKMLPISVLPVPTPPQQAAHVQPPPINVQGNKKVDTDGGCGCCCVQ